MSEKDILNMPTLYQMNQKLMENEKKLSGLTIVNKQKHIETYFSKSPCSYYMLLCHDDRDYTIFKLSGPASTSTAAKEVVDCLKNRGDILAIDKVDKTDAFEIWIRAGGKNLCYYLFNYNEGVIEC